MSCLMASHVHQKSPIHKSGHNPFRISGAHTLLLHNVEVHICRPGSAVDSNMAALVNGVEPCIARL